MSSKVEFRACQKCGQIEKVATDEIIVQGHNFKNCLHEVENWTVFVAAEDWQPTPGKPLPKVVIIPTAGWSDVMAQYAVCFVQLVTTQAGEDAVVAGSGTFVQVGKVFGILTAAHVLEILPDNGPVGISQFSTGTVNYRKHTIEMSYAEKLLIGGSQNAPGGPDLGFLRLGANELGWLTALASFYNLGLHENDEKKSPPAPQKVTSIVGAIAERTKDLPPERPGEYRKGFEGIISDGNVMSEHQLEDFNLLEFIPKSYPDFELPGSYGGTSGGALWDVYFDIEEGTPKFVESRLSGVPFFQSAPAEDGRRTLICHSSRDVYGSLLAAMRIKWPTECGD